MLLGWTELSRECSWVQFQFLVSTTPFHLFFACFLTLVWLGSGALLQMSLFPPEVSCRLVVCQPKQA